MYIYRKFVVAILVLISFILCVSQSHAQKIHLLIAADTNDESIGQGVAKNVPNLETWFRAHVPTKDLTISKVTGRNFSRQGILSAVDRINPRSSDGLVVIVCCHGAYSRNGHYLSMHSQQNLYRKDLVAKVKLQGAGTDVVITDACNIFLEPPTMEFGFEGEPPSQIAPLFKSLFLDARGVVDINSASEGQVSWTCSQDGSFFINVVGDILINKAHTKMNWHQFVALLDRGLKDVYKSNGGSLSDSRTGYTQREQNVRVWSLPDKSSLPNPHKLYYLRKGDVILSVNGVAVKNGAEYKGAVRKSGRIMRFRVRDAKDGRVYIMETTLRDSSPRFGVYYKDAYGGASVTGRKSGYPCTKCRLIGVEP